MTVSNTNINLDAWGDEVIVKRPMKAKKASLEFRDEAINEMWSRDYERRSPVKVDFEEVRKVKIYKKNGEDWYADNFVWSRAYVLSPKTRSLPESKETHGCQVKPAPLEELEEEDEVIVKRPMRRDAPALKTPVETPKLAPTTVKSEIVENKIISTPKDFVTICKIDPKMELKLTSADQQTGLLTCENVSLRFTEIIDVNAMNALCRSDKIDKDTKAILGRTRKAIVRGNELDNIYIPSKQVIDAHGNFPLGRFYAKDGVGLQSMPRDVRSAIGKKYYHDLDLTSAHPSLLYQIMTKQFANQGSFFALDRYVHDREEVLKDVCKTKGISRSQAKVEVLKLVFNHYPGSDDKAKELGEYAYRFHRDIARAADILSRSDEYGPQIKASQESISANILKNKVKNNRLGHALSIVLCTAEAILLQFVIKTLGELGYKVDVPIFDGCLVRKKVADETCLPLSIVERLEEAIFDHFHIRVKLDSKPLVSTLDDIVKQETEKAEQPIDKKIQDAFEKKACAWIDDKRQTLLLVKPFARFSKATNETILTNQLVIYEDWSAVMKELEHSPEIGQVEVDGKIQTIDLPRWWKSHTKRRATRLVFDPSLEPGFHSGVRPELSFYNTFQGYDYDGYDAPFTDEDRKNVESFLDLAKNLVGGEENAEECYHYLINHLASIYQKPSEKTRMCIILKSRQGSGKDTLFNAFGGLIGKDSYIISGNPSCDFLKDYNSIVKSAIVVKMEEVSFSAVAPHVETFKSLMTAPNITISEKYEKRYNLDSFHNFLGTTNNDIPVPIQNDDRRFCIFRANDLNNGDKQYWETLQNHFATESFKKSLARFFRNHQIPLDFNSERSRPDTQIYRNTVLACRSWQFDVFESLIVGKHDDLIREGNFGKITVKNDGSRDSLVGGANQILSLFQAIAAKNPLSKQPEVTAVKLCRYLEVPGITRKRIGSGNCYTFDFDTLKNHLVKNKLWTNFY